MLNKDFNYTSSQKALNMTNDNYKTRANPITHTHNPDIRSETRRILRNNLAINPKTLQNPFQQN